MRKYGRLFILIILVSMVTIDSFGQSNDKIWFDGLARSYYARDAIGENEQVEDTLSAKNVSNGYNLLDLNTHVNPIEDIEIFAQLRIQNKFGGFFGSGTSVNVRQLQVKGVINKSIRFGLGDLFLKQSRYTLYNDDEELSSFENDMFKPYRDIIHYENFYLDNRWRLQGLQSDFSFEFDRGIRTLEFDLFLTRPRGSNAISTTTYSSDQLLTGGSVISKLTKNLELKSHYINLFEVASSGTSNISVRNPVYLIGLKRLYKNKNHQFESKIQGGFSQRYWLHSELENNVDDSTSNYNEGLFFDFQNNYVKKDSTLQLSVNYRYVDPNFRSAGAQTRRLNFGQELSNTIYPNYTNNFIQRPTSIFDLLSDERIYNQQISSNLMVFNPVYSNALPYGDATPNRNGADLKAKIHLKNKIIQSLIKAGFYRELVGQGTPNKRSFALFKTAVKINMNEGFHWKKELSLSGSYEAEYTSRGGDTVSQVQLLGQQINIALNAEVLPKFFVQLAYKQFNADGNEFLTQRDNYGNINNFVNTHYKQKDHLLSAGLMYKLRDDVYANIQFNSWGMSFNDEPELNYNYNRLLFILSVTL